MDINEAKRLVPGIGIRVKTDYPYNALVTGVWEDTLVCVTEKTARAEYKWSNYGKTWEVEQVNTMPQEDVEAEVFTRIINMDEKIWNETIEYLEQFAKVTKEVEDKIRRHVKRYSLKDGICAWYADWEDFCSDWCDGIGYTRTWARKLLHGGIGEFQIIKGFGIVRYVM